MVRAAHARRKVRAAAVNVVARWVGVAAFRYGACTCGTSVCQHIFQMVRAAHARRKVRAAAVNVVARRVGVAAGARAGVFIVAPVRAITVATVRSQIIFQMVRAGHARLFGIGASVKLFARTSDIPVVGRFYRVVQRLSNAYSFAELTVRKNILECGHLRRVPFGYVLIELSLISILVARKHVCHCGHLRRVPIIEWLIEHLRVPKHVCHCGHLRRVPIIEWLIEHLRISKHVCHCGHLRRGPNH